jgi:hypothetical protein
MGRLRRSTKFGQRNTISQSIEPSKIFIFIIATEGNLTEKLYFEGFNEKAHELGIKDRVIVEVLDRDDTKSAPQYVKELLDEYKHEYGVESEELWMVIDRDRQNTSREFLIELVHTCKEACYNIALTNPCFEFWLLLHVADINQYTPEVLFQNAKVNSKRRFIDRELSCQLGGYDKTKLKFEKFQPHLRTAIAQAELFAVEVHEIIDALGTNLHILVKNILRI